MLFNFSCFSYVCLSSSFLFYSQICPMFGYLPIVWSEHELPACRDNPVAP